MQIEGLIKRSKSAEKRANYEAQLLLPKFPIEIEGVWRTFWRLRRRIRNIHAIQPITWGDMVDFKALTSVPLSPWEVDLIEMLDNLFIKANADADADGDEGDES